MSSHVKSVPSSRHRDLGLFLMFLGAAVSLPVRALLEAAFPKWTMTGSLSVLGLLLILYGLYIYRFTRKRFSVENQTITIQDGDWLGKRLRYTWQEPPKIRLRSQEEEHGGKTVEFWLVNLVDGKRQYVLDRREGSQIASRSLAEALAKTINCPVLAKCEAGEIVIPREELDLPFRERVKRYPDLLGPEVPRPENCGIQEVVQGDQHQFHWKLLNPSTLQEYFSLVMLAVFLAILPLFTAIPADGGSPERFQASFFDLAWNRHQYVYFWVTGTLLGALGLLLFGYRKRLDVTPERVHAQDRLWGVPCWSASIPANELEEIWVRQSNRGAHLELVSDRCIISGRLSNARVAGWLASLLRRYYS